MFGIFRKAPPPGSTDHAARQILNLLEQEEREKRELRRLQAEGWRAPADSAPPASERRFGDGRDDLMQLVQSGLDQRQALRGEARRRVQLAQANAGVPIPPRKPAAPLARTAGSNLLYAPIDSGRNVEATDRAKFRGALDMRKDVNPSMRAILDHVFDFEGGYKPDGTTVTGIQKGTLDEYLTDFYKTNPGMRRVWQDRWFTPAELSDQQRIAFMRWYADARMGDIDVGEIESPRRPKSFGDPKLAGLLFDSMYRYGKGSKSTTEGMTAPLQKAINDTLSRYWSDAKSAGVRTRDQGQMPRTIKVDNQSGPETRDTIRLLLDAGYADELRAAINDRILEMNITPTDEERKKGITKKEESANDAYRRSVFR